MRRILALLLILCCLCPSGLAEAAFVPGEDHTFTLDFSRFFQTLTASCAAGTLTIEKSAYDETQTTALLAQIDADVAALRETLSLSEEQLHAVTLYIVDPAPIGIQTFPGRIYCTAEDVFSGAYRSEMTFQLLNADARWKGYGLAEIVFGKAPADPRTQLLAGVKMFSLQDPYFMPDFASPTERARAACLSRLLCEHALSEHGLAFLLADPCLDCRKAILREYDAEALWQDRTFGFDAGYTYTRTKNTPLVVTTGDGHVFHIQPYDDQWTTAAQVVDFLWEADWGVRRLLEGIEADAPMMGRLVRGNYRAPISYYTHPISYDTMVNFSVTYSAIREIYLSTPLHVSHETIHILVPNLERTSHEMFWLNEGVATYLQQRYAPNTYDLKYALRVLDEKKLFFFETPSDSAAYYSDLRNYYLTDHEQPASIEDVDYFAFCRANVRAALLHPELDLIADNISTLYQEVGNGYTNQTGGNELSYDEAACFVGYLVEQKGLDALLRLCLSPKATFQGIYGMTYEEAKAAWLDDLLR